MVSINVQLPKQLLNRYKLASDLFPPLTAAKKGSLKNDSTSQALFILNGLIHNVNHGSYAILPLLNRSLKKLKSLIEDEMNYIGAHEIFMPSLINETLWRRSGRLYQAAAMRDVYQVTDRRKKVHLLAPTQEEVVTQLVSKFKLPEKKLPLMLYQISSKFRDEPRTKHGLMRTSEFIMKDLYTFDANLDQAKLTYKKVGDAYDRILHLLDLKYIKAISDVGDIGGIFSHEYHLPATIGEDSMLVCDDCNEAWNKEYLTKQDSLGYQCLKCKSSRVVESNGIEIGHTFLLSTIYSSPFKSMFISKQGDCLPLEMGCFGLGVTRILAAATEILSVTSPDGYSQLRWPNAIAPYQVCIITPKEGSTNDNSEVLDNIKDLVEKIIGKTDSDVLVDDRNSLNIGRRLLDIQSLGIPNVIVVGHKFAETNKIELHRINKDDASYSEYLFLFDEILNNLTLPK